LSVDSILHFFSKYLRKSERLPGAPELKRLMAAVVDDSFRGACGSAIGVKNDSDAVEALCEYYKLQQKCRVHQSDPGARRRPWLLDALAPSWRRHACPERMELQTAQTVLASIAAGVEAPIAAARESALKRWLLPRHLLTGDIMGNRIQRFSEGLPAEPSAAHQLVQSFVDRYVGASRRVWNGVPSHLLVCAQSVQAGSSVLFCKDARTGEDRILVSGWKRQDGFHALGNTFALDDRILNADVGSAAGGSVWLNIGRDSTESSNARCLWSHAQELRPRAFTYRF
jgi:hypothetical protein